jgi:hypothetical protein
MGGARSMNVECKMSTKFLLICQKERENLEDQGTDGKIIL